MIEKRKVLAVMLLLAFSAASTAGWNWLDADMRDSWEMPEPISYLPGLATAVVGLLIHVYLIRRIWPFHQARTEGVGLLISGLISAALWEIHMCLPEPHVPVMRTLPWILVSACVVSLIFFPFLTILEHWVYSVDSREQGRGSLTKTADKLP